MKTRKYTVSRHTPIPWEIRKDTDYIWIKSEDSNSIAMLRRTLKEGMVNADFIVCAVNSHYKLIETLKKCREFVRGYEVPELDEVIANAEGKCI